VGRAGDVTRWGFTRPRPPMPASPPGSPGIPRPEASAPPAIGIAEDTFAPKPLERALPRHPLCPSPQPARAPASPVTSATSLEQLVRVFRRLPHPSHQPKPLHPRPVPPSVSSSPATLSPPILSRSPDRVSADIPWSPTPELREGSRTRGAPFLDGRVQGLCRQVGPRSSLHRARAQPATERTRTRPRRDDFAPARRAGSSTAVGTHDELEWQFPR
jgi:hypothetical protein